MHTYTCLAALKSQVDTSRTVGGGARLPPRERVGDLLHPPPPSGAAECPLPLPTPPRGTRKRALVTLNDSGSERRPLTGKGKAEPGRRGKRLGDLARGSAKQGGARRGGRRGRGAAAPEVPAPPEEAQRAPSGRAGGKAPRSSARQGLAGAGGSGAAAPSLPRDLARPVPGTAPGREGGREEAARRPSGELRDPAAWAASPQPHGLRSGRGLRGAAARRHV